MLFKGGINLQCRQTSPADLIHNVVNVDNNILL